MVVQGNLYGCRKASLAGSFVFSAMLLGSDLMLGFHEKLVKAYDLGWFTPLEYSKSYRPSNEKCSILGTIFSSIFTLPYLGRLDLENANLEGV